MNINSTDLQKIFNKEILNKKIKIDNVTINSKEVNTKSIFFAIKGKNTDGHYFAKFSRDLIGDRTFINLCKLFLGTLKLFFTTMTLDPFFITSFTK